MVQSISSAFCGGMAASVDTFLIYWWKMRIVGIINYDSNRETNKQNKTKNKKNWKRMHELSAHGRVRQRKGFVFFFILKLFVQIVFRWKKYVGFLFFFRQKRVLSTVRIMELCAKHAICVNLLWEAKTEWNIYRYVYIRIKQKQKQNKEAHSFFSSSMYCFFFCVGLSGCKHTLFAFQRTPTVYPKLLTR